MLDTSKVELAHRLCGEGKFQEALPLFKELEHDTDNPTQAAGYLIDEATCYAYAGNSSEAEDCISRARVLVSADPLSLAQIDFFKATLLIEHGHREEALELLRIVSENSPWRTTDEGQELYEKAQIQRGFTLMHLSKRDEARRILEEALSFHLDDDMRSSVHCHLGRCYHEMGDYAAAKEHFILAQRLMVPENWDGVFHYYYGYALYELGEFDFARREFILSLQSESSGPPTSYKYRMLAATHRKLGEADRARHYEELARSDLTP